MEIPFTRTSRLMHQLALASSLCLCAFWSTACGLFTPIDEPTCADLPTTCVCPGGATGEATCDPDTLTIERCDCAKAPSCAESTRALCRCPSAQSDAISAAIGLSACADPEVCVCQEFAPASTSSALVLPRLEGTQTLDGSCAEFGDTPIAPQAGFTSDETLARMSCRLMWHAPPDGSRQVLGCCMVPDDDIWTRADSTDPPSVRGTDGSQGDDRIELTLADSSGTLHQIAINAQSPSATVFASTITGQTILLATSEVATYIAQVGKPNSVMPSDSGYTIEWAWTLPASLHTLDAFSCQLSRYDVTAASSPRATLDQEHTFGMSRTTSPTAQMGSCTLSIP